MTTPPKSRRENAETLITAYLAAGVSAAASMWLQSSVTVPVVRAYRSGWVYTPEDDPVVVTIRVSAVDITRTPSRLYNASTYILGHTTATVEISVHAVNETLRDDMDSILSSLLDVPDINRFLTLPSTLPVGFSPLDEIRIEYLRHTINTDAQAWLSAAYQSTHSCRVKGTYYGVLPTAFPLQTEANIDLIFLPGPVLGVAGGVLGVSNGLLGVTPP